MYNCNKLYKGLEGWILEVSSYFSEQERATMLVLPLSLSSFLVADLFDPSCFIHPNRHILVGMDRIKQAFTGQK